MKKIYYKLVAYSLFSLLLNSCNTYYQVHETKSDTVILQDNKYSYNGEDFLITYFFWDEKGIMNYNIYNKSDKPIFIDFNRSHFINNGQSFDYYKGESSTLATAYTKGTTYKGYYTSNTYTTIAGQSITKFDKRVVEIQPNTYINIGDYNIINGFYDNCDIRKKIPRNSNPIVLNFDANSPYTFNNIVTYSFSEDFKNSKVINNKFWVNTIYIITQQDLFGKTSSIDDCGFYTGKYHYSFPYSKPNSYWIKWK